MIRLAIITTHPIQYYAPLFQALARSDDVLPHVFYTWSQSAESVADRGFGRSITWDIPLLDGYEYEFVPNVAARPGTHHFWGLRTPTLNTAIERWRPDAILLIGWNNAAHLQALRHFKRKVPVFFRGDSNLLQPRPPLKAAARRAFLTWVYRHIDVAIAVGSNNHDYYRWCGVPEHRIGFAPHAVDTHRFSDPGGEHTRRAREWRAELGLTRGNILLFAGKLQPVKAPELLLQAFLAAQPESSPSHRLLFVGEGVLESRLREQAAGRSDIVFLPFQNQQAMPAVYRLGDTYILPSRSETWGLALNEAMACGCPIVASSRVGGARDLIRDRANGWVFEAGNLDALTALVGELLAHAPERLRELGQAAEREARRWSIDAAAEGIRRTVLEFCRAGSLPASA